MEGYAVDSGAQETRRRLKRAGFRGDNLDAMTEVLAGMEETLATKEDLAKAESGLKQDIADVRTEIKQDIAGLRLEVRLVLFGARCTLSETASAGRWMASGARWTASTARCGRSSGFSADSSLWG